MATHLVFIRSKREVEGGTEVQCHTISINGTGSDDGVSIPDTVSAEDFDKEVLKRLAIDVSGSGHYFFNLGEVPYYVKGS